MRQSEMADNLCEMAEQGLRQCPEDDINWLSLCVRCEPNETWAGTDAETEKKRGPEEFFFVNYKCELQKGPK